MRRFLLRIGLLSFSDDVLAFRLTLAALLALAWCEERVLSRPLTIMLGAGAVVVLNRYVRRRRAGEGGDRGGPIGSE